MVFDNIKESFRSRHVHSRPSSAIPSFRTEQEKADRQQQLQETMNVFNRLGHSISSKNFRLPPIPYFKPINLSGLEIFNTINSKDNPVANVPAEIRRKPCPSINTQTTAAASPSPARSEILHRTSRAFDPCAPITNPDLHKRAREALKRRYQSKFIIDFEPPAGVSAHNYYFLWCDSVDLDLKVLQDLVWVRERYLQAKQGEPSDEDIIRWYDAQIFDTGGELGQATEEGSSHG